MVGSRVEWHCFPSAKRKKCNATQDVPQLNEKPSGPHVSTFRNFSAWATIRSDPFLAVYRCIFNPILCIFQESINYRAWPVDYCIKVHIVQLSNGAWNHRHIQRAIAFHEAAAASRRVYPTKHSFSVSLPRKRAPHCFYASILSPCVQLQLTTAAFPFELNGCEFSRLDTLCFWMVPSSGD